VAGYAISGRAGHSAYLQRLAVEPSKQQRGIGRALTIDSLVWAKRHRCGGVLVNTHVDNDPALGLYRSLGFVEMGYRLAVLERSLV
jgi:ribosomal-protein-alanine N-acetyltransferase